ncbi:MAG: TIGR03619 family F420-dependent LLM class oxidoreductase [Jatrophihabitans sp.]|uniref:TIGR03619 family F420-dependent LLM class oxidoreductase n=1 Tax=Jatrophihabitans sp. TaxID=1932789 RepID=UPI003F81EB69
MELSIALPTSGSWATPANIVTVAQAAERAGCRGVWTFQRVLYPVGTPMPSVYRSVLDPITTLAYAAAVTSRVRLGVAVVNGPFYAPAVLAKQLAAVDVLSDGRLDAGIGLGWNAEEYETVGLPMERRGKRFDEWLDCLDAVLTNPTEGFRGDFYSVPASEVLPRCVQQPRPPIYIGGSSEAAYRRAGRRGDGFISNSRATLADVTAAMNIIRATADEAGRPAPRCVMRGVTMVRDEVPGDDRRPLQGTPEQIAADLARYESSGVVDEVFLDLNFDSDEVGNDTADPQRSLDRALGVLEACTAR